MLTIDLYSFGFRFSGIPANTTGDGGGFVFDCRFLPNPYHNPELKEYTGLDAPIVAFFAQYPEVDRFIRQSLEMVLAAAEKYRQRDFKHLQVSFGCTGGRHRSVYCSERLRELLQKEGFQVALTHTELQ